MTKINWYKLRWWWHAPQFWLEGTGPETPIQIWWNCCYYSKIRGPADGRKYLREFGCKGMLQWVWFQRWRILFYCQPFRCNGNKGGWQTRFCDWLEKKSNRMKRERENGVNVITDKNQ